MPVTALNKTTRAPALKVAAGKPVLEWGHHRYPVPLIRNSANGEVISFARDDRIELSDLPAKTIDVPFGDGVNSIPKQFKLP